MKDGGVTEQRGSLVLYTYAESGLRAWSLGSWSLDCGVWDELTVGTLTQKETVERTWQTTCSTAAYIGCSQGLCQLCTDRGWTLPCMAAFTFFTKPLYFVVWVRRQWLFSSKEGLQRQTEGKLESPGWGVLGCWGTPAVEFLMLPSFILVTPCFHFHHHPPSLTVPCPSVSCRFQIKESISLMSPPVSNPHPLPPTLFFPSHSIFFCLLHSISLNLLCEATWLFSISLSLESVSWASVWTLHAQTKTPFFIPSLSLSLLGFEMSCLEHCFPTKTGGRLRLFMWAILCLFHWLWEKGNETSFIFFLPLSAAPLFSSKISTRNPSKLLCLPWQSGQYTWVTHLFVPAVPWSGIRSWHQRHYST